MKKELKKIPNSKNAPGKTFFSYCIPTLEKFKKADIHMNF